MLAIMMHDSIQDVLVVTLKLMRLVIKDHDVGCNERPKFAGILAHKFVRLGHIRITITLWRIWLLENMIGVGCAPRVPEIAGWGARWIIWPASRRDVRGPAWRS